MIQHNGFTGFHHNKNKSICNSNFLWQGVIKKLMRSRKVDKTTELKLNHETPWDRITHISIKYIIGIKSFGVTKQA